MYTDETQILIMLFSKPKKKWKNVVLQKNAFEVYELQKHDTVRNVRYSATFYQKKGESGGKKGRKTQFSIRQLLRVDLIVEIDSWS